MTQIFECENCDYVGPDVFHHEATGMALCEPCIAKADKQPPQLAITLNEWMSLTDEQMFELFEKGTAPLVDATMKQEPIIVKLTEDLNDFLNDRYAEYVDGDDALDELWEAIVTVALQRAASNIHEERD